MGGTVDHEEPSTCGPTSPKTRVRARFEQGLGLSRGTVGEINSSLSELSLGVFVLLLKSSLSLWSTFTAVSACPCLGEGERQEYKIIHISVYISVNVSGFTTDLEYYFQLCELEQQHLIFTFTTCQ